MKTSFRTLSLGLGFLLLLLSSSCKKSTDKDFNKDDWKITEIFIRGAATLIEPTNDYMLTIGKDGVLSFNLDVNSCETEYNVPWDGYLWIKDDVACTYVCCDSPLAEEIPDVLDEVNAYHLKNDKLYLKKEDDILITLSQQ